MKPSTVWIAIVLLAIGACGILDAAGVVDSSQTIALWWPLAIVGWAIAEMLAERRVTVGGVVCAASVSRSWPTHRHGPAARSCGPGSPSSSASRFWLKACEAVSVTTVITSARSPEEVHRERPTASARSTW